MTTDITELAQSLKAAAENAIGAHERLAAYPYGEIIDISQHEGEQIDIDITDLNEFNKEANPVNIIALVEALEKAENTAGVAGMAESYETTISMLKSRISELEESHSQVIQSRDHYKRMTEEGLKRLAESRTVTVKPMRPGHITVGGEKIRIYMRDEVDEFLAALTAAGIKWEAE
ncbi:ead/Ea22-like family protein [Klebsiella oxytoca]|uniref:ead/Ea22-like family protein n=1 Tax=Klebsiella oxytoca TaxID=571 RepID=UPI0025959495|nr:ead/Ea22-like family protein [Klebsiella oxytoca]MDM4129238.1 ead/Ea22-like family protein [Klebsiella oxytoca]MDM4146123.1 ead/Ea22-like family protein [Klebsiella oxytoca]MDM4178864.1 ead/Ea22-like family protein [Klebsiella oxytoca]MDM4197152.1 ead/Ea22-like family protein [Klebsiella oxytoca]